MAVLPRELLVKGSGNMPEDDAATEVGGGVDVQTGVMFTSAPGLYQVVSSDAADIAVAVELTFRDAANRVQSDLRTLQGQVPVAFSQGVLRLLKAVKSIPSDGVVAVEHQVPTVFDFAVSGGVDQIELPMSAPAATGALIGHVVRITEGPAAGEISQVIEYDGPTRTAYLSTALSASVTTSSKIRVAPGMVFHRTPFEELTVRRLLYSVAPAVEGGAQRKFYGKMFFYNASAQTLTWPRIVELFDTPGRFRYGPDADGVDGSSTNGAGNNRRVAPAGVTFANGETFLADTELPPDSAIGVWVEETVEPNQVLDDYLYQLLIAGD